MQNHKVERIWVEVNTRVNYPLKRLLIYMEEHQSINMTDPVSKFCMSFVTIKVASKGMETFVHSWNNHPAPSKLYTYVSCIPICNPLPEIRATFLPYEMYSVIDSGVPNERQQHHSETTAVPSHAVPQADNAKRLYEAEGGRISEPGTFGTDPLKDRPDLVQRRNGVFHA